MASHNAEFEVMFVERGQDEKGYAKENILCSIVLTRGEVNNAIADMMTALLDRRKMQTPTPMDLVAAIVEERGRPNVKA